MTNKKGMLLSFAIGFAVINLACAQQKTTPVLKKISAAIENSNKLYSQGFETHQVKLIVERYTSDAEIMAPGMKGILNPDGFAAFFTGGYEHGIRQVLFQTTKLFGFSGTTINEEGLYELKGADGKVLDQGKYIVVWKKTAEGWKMFRDIFNTNLSGSK